MDDTLAPTGLVPSSGRIDIHSHILPGVDDGCRDLDESLACVRRLLEEGFIGSICTPHVYPESPWCPTIKQIQTRVEQLAGDLRNTGLNYHLWPGAELRLFDGVVDWMEVHGPPTLAGSRCVLVDFWVNRWPMWVIPAFEWLLEHGYQPILAHPERLGCTDELDDRLLEVTQMGVWLQGNFRSMTGQEGIYANHWVRKLLDEGLYRFMAMDMHRPNQLDARFVGMRTVEKNYGIQVLDSLTMNAPCRDILEGVA